MHAAVTSHSSAARTAARPQCEEWNTEMELAQAEDGRWEGVLVAYRNATRRMRRAEDAKRRERESGHWSSVQFPPLATYYLPRPLTTKQSYLLHSRFSKASHHTFIGHLATGSNPASLFSGCQQARTESEKKGCVGREFSLRKSQSSAS